MTQRLQYLVAGGLALLWLSVVVMRWAFQEPPQEVPLQFKTGQRPSQQARLAAQEDDLAVKPFTGRGQEVPDRPHKNIFVMGPTASQEASDGVAKPVQKKLVTMQKTPVPPPPVVSPPAGPTDEELAAIAARQQRELLMQQVREQLAQFRYVGYVERDGRQQAFLGKDNQIFILQQGDKVENRFVVATIDRTAVTLREGQTKIEGRIELTKDLQAGPS